MNARLFWLRLFWACPLLALPLAAQSDLSSYQGPGILSAGVGNLGNRSGQQVDLRFWGGVNGIYSTNLQPLNTDAQGNLIHVPNLFGVEATVGAYGGHHWEHAELGLSYTGSYRYYPDAPAYDGTNQGLTLGLTAQYSSRITFDFRLSGDILSNATGVVADAVAVGGSSNGPQLFDSRSGFVDVTGSMTFVQSPRTSYTFGAGADDYYYQSSRLISSSGFHLNASANHRLSPSNSIGAVYTYMKQISTSYSAQTQSFAGQYFGNFGRNWGFNLTAGASVTQSHQQVAVQLDPLLAFLFNTPFVIVPYNATFISPTGRVELTRQFQRASASVNYSRSVGAGNGVLLTSRNDMASAGISYTGIRKWNFGLNARYTALVSLGQPPGKTTWYGGGTGITYEIAPYTHLSARFDVGRYDFGASLLTRTNQQATLGILFSPGSIPLSLW